MASMLEALREYRHLAARRRAEGGLPVPLQARLDELEVLLRAAREAPSSPPPSVEPESPSARLVAADRESASERPEPTSPSLPARVTERVSDPSLDTAIDPIGLRLEGLIPNPSRRRAVFIGTAAVLSISAVVIPLFVGLPLITLLSRVLPETVLVGSIAWALLYPGLMAWSELRGRQSKAHLSEPDFVVRLPLLEPMVATFALLASVVWVLTSGVAAEGVGEAIGAVLSFVFGTSALGLVAMGLVRPVSARIARARAYAQYVEGSSASLAKNNPRRARRLLERAMGNALEPERIADLESRYERVVLAEAEHLRHRGHDEQADALIRRLTTVRKSKRRPQPIRSNPRAPAAKRFPPSATEVVPKRASPPKLLPLRAVRLEEGETSAPSEPSRRTLYDRALSLAAKDRAREAVEVLVSAGLPIGEGLADQAAKQYVAQGMLRSALALFEALGQEQIPEFYRAAAVEWVRAGQDQTDRLEYGEVLLSALERQNEHAAAARVACQAALGPGARDFKRVMAARAKAGFSRLNQEPPPELYEELGDHQRAATLYEQEGRTDEARRCYGRRADEMLNGRARPASVIPVLSKLFHLDPTLRDEHLSPLVDHVVETHATGPLAQRILTTWRNRHPEDQRVSFRLFHLLVAAERVDDALSELTRLASRQGSQPASLVEDFRRLVETFPEHFGAREGLVRTLTKAGRVQEAAEELSVLFDWGIESLSSANRHVLRNLVNSLREWGHVDREMDRFDGLLALSLGNETGALASLESYANAGGREPEALKILREALEAKLVNRDGGPDYPMHARLARFLFSAGRAEEARPYLEVLRASPTHADEALALLARIQLEGTEPQRALNLLATALDGRRPADAPELFFELARAYEALGDVERSRRVDEAIERARPGFSSEYAPLRPRVERADTALLSGSDTDVNGVYYDDRTIDETALGIPVGARVQPPEKDSGNLSEALAPRYRLIRRLGSGGMGEVHLAEDLVLGREVAVKVLRRTLATDLFIAKFRDEARIVAQLSHPGIVGVFDIGQQGDWSYIVMEYVRGPNLATLVSASVPPPRSQILEYVATVSDAMAYAHRRGVVHRDLKPANILVGVDGVVKVTDFGIARVLAGERGEQTAFSAAGLQVGTINFMAPEQLLHDRADARTDIYLLATTLYYCLSKRYPFSGEAAQLRKTREEAPRLSTRVSGVSPELDQVVANAIARNPEDRPSSMLELAAALRAVPEAFMAEDKTELFEDPN